MNRMYTFLGTLNRTSLLLLMVFGMFHYLGCSSGSKTTTGSAGVNQPQEAKDRTLLAAVNLSSLIANPKCSTESWMQSWMDLKKQHAASLYLGEQTSAQDPAMIASQYQLATRWASVAHPDVSLIAPPMLSFGLKTWITGLQKQGTHQARWLFDYTVAQVPWKSVQTLAGMAVYARTDDLLEDQPLYLDYPSRQRPDVLKASVPQFSAQPALFIVRPSDATVNELPSLKENQWGLVLPHGLMSQGGESTYQMLERKNWIVVRPSQALFTITLDADGGGEIEPIACEQMKQGKAAPQVAAYVKELEQASKNKSVRQWQEVLAKLSYDLTPDRPEEPKGTSLGYWFAEVIRQVAHADFAIIPTASVNSVVIQSGDLTRAKLLRAFPNDEKIFLVDLTGKELLRILNQHAHNFFQKGMFPFYYKGKLVKIHLSGSPRRVEVDFQSERMYKVVTLQSMILQSKRFFGVDLSGMATPLKFNVQQGLEIFSRFHNKTLADPALGSSGVTFVRGT